jgi:hypothetical protein
MSLITLADVKTAALAAHAAGLLTAQAPDKEDSHCVNHRLCSDGVERRCAAAWAMPEEHVKKFGQGWVRNKVHVDLFASDDLLTISAIQQAHDDWAMGRRHNESRDQLADRERHLLRLLA